MAAREEVADESSEGNRPVQSVQAHLTTRCRMSFQHP